MLIVEDTEMAELERLLKKSNEKAFPYAARQMLNDTVWEGRRLAQKDIKADFVNRNKWTAGSIRVILAKTLNMDRMEARMGSTQEYMRHQEEGHTIVSKGKHGVPIPTSYAAGQKGAQPRTRLPRKANRMHVIRLAQFINRGKTVKQRVLRAVQHAVKTGNRYVFMDFGPGKRKGILKVLGGRRTFKRGWPLGARLEMVQDMTQKSVVIKPHPWMEPSIKAAERRKQEFYRKGLIFQLKRLGFKFKGTP